MSGLILALCYVGIALIGAIAGIACVHGFKTHD